MAFESCAAVRALLARAGSDWSVIIEVIAAGRLAETDYKGKMIYLKRFFTG